MILAPTSDICDNGLDGAALKDLPHIKQRLSDSDEVLKAAVRDRAFPGAAYAVVCDRKIALGSTGRFTFDNDSAPVTTSAIYDLASLTKVVATTAIAMLLYQRGQLDLDAPVASLAPEFCSDSRDPRRAQVTLRMLLTHTSGLPGYVRLFETHRTRENLIQAAMSVPLTADPGVRTDYSDIGFIILGETLATIAGEPIPSFLTREILIPLRMTETAFNPPASWRDRIPPTEDDRNFRHRIIHAEVNDENASVMDGVAGHAGIFATAPDVALLARCMLAGGAPLFRGDIVELFTRAQEGTSRGLGWDKPTAPSQSGQYFSESAFGHLGFTGTSLWIDPKLDLAVVLLTNRTWPDRSNQAIKQVRPRFHDAVVKAITS